MFNKVNLASALWHFELDESSLLTTFANPYGRFRWLRWPFSLCKSSEIFQKHLHQEKQVPPGVMCIADDVLIYDKYDDDQDKNMDNFIQKYQQKAKKLNRDKLQQKCKEVSFHGYLLTTKAIKPDLLKVKAFIKMPRPETPGVLRLNGMVNYVSRFLPNLSDVMKPLRDLPHKNTERRWADVQEKAWSDVKALIASASVLSYYRLGESLEVQCDSSTQWSWRSPDANWATNCLSMQVER